MEEKIYRGNNEIGKRIGISKNLVTEILTREDDPLPARRIGRQWFTTETNIALWMNKIAVKAFVEAHREG
jgi:hypothetical protein